MLRILHRRKNPIIVGVDKPRSLRGRDMTNTYDKYINKYIYDKCDIVHTLYDICYIIYITYDVLYYI